MSKELWKVANANNFSKKNRIRLSLALRFSGSRSGAARQFAKHIQEKSCGVDHVLWGTIAYRCVCTTTDAVQQLDKVAEAVHSHGTFDDVVTATDYISQKMRLQSNRRSEFHANQVALDLAFWGYVKETTDNRTTCNSRKGLSLANRLEPTRKTAADFAVELGTTDRVVKTVACEWEKLWRRWNTGWDTCRTYTPRHART